MFQTALNNPHSVEFETSPGNIEEQSSFFGGLDAPSFSFDDVRRGSFESTAVILDGDRIKRKVAADEVAKDEEHKRNKLKLGGARPLTHAHIIETTAESEADGIPLMLNDVEVFALSDALSDTSTDSLEGGESGDESSGDCEDDEEEEGGDEGDCMDEGDGGGESALRKGVKSATGGGSSQKDAKRKTGRKGRGGHLSKKARGNYACSKCGLPKRGHVCAFKPRARRRDKAAGGGTGGGAVTPSAASSSKAALQRLRAIASDLKGKGGAKAVASAAAAAATGSGRDPPSKLPPKLRAKLVNAAAGASTRYVRPTGAMRGLAAKKTSSAETQCELEGGNAVRELYLDCQGFPESYAQGILSDPTFKLADARTVTISCAPPKGYKPLPLKVASVSCGSGPDTCAGASVSSLAVAGFNQAGSVASMPAMLATPFNPTTSATGQRNPSVSFGDPLGLLRAQVSAQQAGHISAIPADASATQPPAQSPALTLNHLALIMSTYQHSLAQQHSSAVAAAATTASPSEVAAEVAPQHPLPLLQKQRAPQMSSPHLDPSLVSLFMPIVASGLSNGLSASAVQQNVQGRDA